MARATTLPRPQQIIVGSWRPILQFLSLELHLGTPVSPGQDIVFWWKSDLVATAPLDLGTASIALVLVDPFGNVDPSIQLFPKTALSNSDSQTVSERSFASHLITVHPTDAVANRIFQVGTYRVRLVLSGTGKDGPFESGDALLTVELPTVDDTWWMWTVPAVREAMWKTEHYSISGNFINMSMTSNTASVSVLEMQNLPEDPIQTEKVMGNVMLGTPMGSGQNTAVAFSQTDFAKTWGWFVPVTFVPDIDNMVHSYIYRIRLDITDQYKNAYPPFFTTQNVKVVVMPSDQKQVACVLAAQGMAGAATCLVIAAVFLVVPTWFDLVIAAGWAGAAATLAAAALVVGQVASDPPIPDANYRSVFEPVVISATEYDETKPLASFLEIALNIIAHVEAMGQTDSRLSGAYAARNRRSINLQLKHFEALCQKLEEVGREMHRATSRTAQWFSDYQRKFTPAVLANVAQTLTHDLKTRAAIQKAYYEAGGTLSSFEAITAAAITPDFGSNFSNPSPLIFAIGRLSERLATVSATAKPFAPTT